MGFGQGLSGLNAAAQNLDVIGNNIANSGTVGFKAATASFADVYANSRVGLGTQVAAVNQRFTIGVVSSTGNQFDMAIDGEKGFFRVLDASGAVLYTRNGQFYSDENFNLVNAQGQRLTAYQGDSTTPTPIQVPVGSIPPRPTGHPEEGGITLRGTNLDANQPAVPLAPAFDPSDSTTFTHSLPLTVYDSLGNSHQLTQYFIKRPGGPGSNWEVQYRFSGSGATVTAVPAATNLQYDGNGVIDPAGTTSTALSITGIGGAVSPAAPLNFTVSYANTTQFGGEFAPKFTVGGYPTGDYASMSLSQDGSIVANYTNGKTQVMGSLVLADFNNVQGLKPVGGNAWVETGASGQPVLGRPGTNGLAIVRGQAVEESNVDMGQELVNMIIAQRTYQANAQTIKTQDQILQTLVTMR